MTLNFQKNQGSLPFTNGPSRTEDTAEVIHFDAATPKAAPEPAEEVTFVMTYMCNYTLGYYGSRPVRLCA